MPAATTYSYNPEAIHRLSELEFKICSYQGCACQAKWIEEYLDLGLAHANSSPNAWQANSIQRLFNTLLKAIRNPQASSSWRYQCLDYLYQPYFVLKQLYQQQPLRKCYLCNLLRSYNEVQPFTNKLDRQLRRI